MKILSDIRSAFLDYFEKNGHEVVPSSSLIPSNDPTLLFTNAGMVQFKDIFTGKEKRAYTRAASSQKCLRAGGKHNDLENVGYTARHHTFFEMLGSFSFGDYFKEEAIFYAWEFITGHLNVPKDKLLVTVYSEDHEAAQIWKKLTNFGDDKIIKISTSDNFWSMGDTGPCGPCTEIFYDHGPKIKGGVPGSKDQDGDRYTEIWNLVFMQYEQTVNERLNLPSPSIDTGMGLERIAAVLQGVHDNYETDLFKSLINMSVELTGQKEPFNTHKVIADHIRATCFLIADGIIPSNEGRGYVLRRIIRRAVRHMYQLGVKTPKFFKLVPTLTHLMADAYPELNEHQSLIENTIYLEEERFYVTLEKGLKILQDTHKVMGQGKIFPGDVAFKLYDTYGFPLDLTEDILKSSGQKVDVQDYQKCMEEQKMRSRASWEGTKDVANQKIWFDIKEKFGGTEFVGYTHHSTQAVVQALVQGDKEIQKAKEGDQIILVCNQTPFYGEAGGQLGDHGVIDGPNGTIIRVIDTQKQLLNLHLHIGKVEKGSISVGDTIVLKINEQRRQKLAHNHSATHLLHGALRTILGKHVMQKGSLVAEGKLRFDFSHNQALTSEQIKEVEEFVNRHIQAALTVTTEILPPEKAKEKGALAFFDEKYGELVRVVSMGIDNSSIEFCGGTHVKNTGEIGLLKITTETSIASGVRRIEAITGEEIIHTFYKLEHHLQEKDQELFEKTKVLNQKVSKLQQKLLVIDPEYDRQVHNNIAVYHKHVPGIDTKDIRQAAQDNLKKLDSGILLYSTVSEEGKVTCIIGVTDDLVPQHDARVLAQKCSEIIGGQGGGGKPNFAQAGGVRVDGISNLVKQLI